MDQIKINNIIEDIEKEDTDENPISKECIRAIDFLLSEDRLCDISYEEDVEEQVTFDSFLQGDDTQCLLFVGDDGIGKTQFLKRYFSLSINDTFKIDNNKLLIFFSCDGNGMLENCDKVKYCSEEIKKVCEYYEQKFIEEDETILNNYDRFYAFIFETKKDALSHPWMGEKLDEPTYLSEIKALKQNKPFTYYMLELKYYLLLSSQISDLIIICDNIKNEKIYFEVAENINNCIRNYNGIKYHGYRTKTILSMNNTAYWELFSSNKLVFDMFVQKKHNFNIRGFIDGRFNCAKQYGEAWMKEHGFDIPALQTVKNALDNLNDRFNRKYQKMILGLCMHNKELVLKSYKKVMLNRTWVRKKHFRYASNAHDENTDFLFNNITCIRALACGNDQVYCPDKTKDYLIPNILYNTEDEDYAIYNLLLMKYFVKQQGFLEYDGYKGEGALVVCEKIWGKGNEYNNFEKAITYLINMKILEKRNVSIEKYSNYLLITDKGKELWDMLHGDSILMELCREDRICTLDLNMKSSYILLNTEKQYLIFEDLLNMTKQFSDIEDRLYQSALARGCGTEYTNAFGKKRMAFYLLEGISKSIAYSISRLNDDLKAKCKEIRVEIESER